MGVLLHDMSTLLALLAVLLRLGSHRAGGGVVGELSMTGSWDDVLELHASLHAFTLV